MMVTGSGNGNGKLLDGVFGVLMLWTLEAMLGRAIIWFEDKSPYTLVGKRSPVNNNTSWSRMSKQWWGKRKIQNSKRNDNERENRNQERKQEKRKDCQYISERGVHKENWKRYYK